MGSPEEKAISIKLFPQGGDSDPYINIIFCHHQQGSQKKEKEMQKQQNWIVANKIKNK